MNHKRNNWFINYHATETSPGLRHLNLRTSYYDVDDFKNKTVLDIGCNAGQMCKFAVDNGASYVMGIEYDTTAVKNARQFCKDNSNIDIICDDIDNYFTFSNLYTFNTVLFLSVIDTQELQNRYGIISRLSEITNNVMYYEGHHTSTYTNLMSNIIKYTKFTTIEYKGKTYDNYTDKLGRDFFKLSKAYIPHNDAYIHILHSLQNNKNTMIAVSGHGGSGKTHIRNKLIKHLINDGINVKITYQNKQNPYSVVYETDKYYIMDDITDISQFHINNKKIVLFDYNSIDILKTPDCIYYVTTTLKQRLSNRPYQYSLHRTPEINNFNFKSMYHISPYEI